jgi:aryl-alcohol dehydrogenase-like predicted oxidoreductase
MEYRQLGNSGLKVSVLTMGTMTFGGKGNFAKVGNLQLNDVRKLIDMVADAGVNLNRHRQCLFRRRLRRIDR